MSMDWRGGLQHAEVTLMSAAAGYGMLEMCLGTHILWVATCTMSGLARQQQGCTSFDLGHVMRNDVFW